MYYILEKIVKNRLIIFCIVTIAFISITHCVDFFGLGPEEEEEKLLPPPDPPTLIAPEDSSYHAGSPLEVEFIWSSVEGAESYQLWLKKGIEETNTDLPSTTHIHNFTESGHQYYYWSVRAYSDKWEDYTDWAETRYLHTYIK